MTNLLHQFKAHWLQRQLAAPGQTVLLAVSGGIDSMVLASLFLEAGIPFAIAHCNFCLRAGESDADEALVRNWCIHHQVTFHVTHFATAAIAAESKKGIQETARDLRYAWFRELCAQFRYARIATAHHAGDNVETLLINIFRGTGISGLHGIPEVNGSIIRPLLFATRQQIAEFATRQEVPYREDASNSTDDYLRNAIRHNVLPVLAELIPNAIPNAAESISRFAEGEVLYRRQIDAERKKLLEKRGQDYYVPIRKLRLRTPLHTICYELFAPFGFSPAQVPHILQLLDAGSGRMVLSATHRIFRDRDFLILTAMPQQSADVIVVPELPFTVHAGKYSYHFSSPRKPDVIPTDADEAWLDMDGLTLPLLLRKWRQGDYLYPLGMKLKKKKVARMLIDAKMPVPDKEAVRVVESNKKIAWIAGMRIDERFKITANTQNVLHIRRTASD